MLLLLAVVALLPVVVVVAIYLAVCLLFVRLFVSVKFCDNRHTNFNGISNVVCQLSSTLSLSLFYYLSLFLVLSLSAFAL